MKLRKRLAVVLMAASVLSAVPVVTNAASTNRVSKTLTVSENTSFTSANAPNLIIEADDAAAGEEFLIELNNANWINWDEKAEGEIILSGTKNAKVVLVDEATARVTVEADGAAISIPMLVEVEEGTATVTVDGGSSTITSGVYTFAKTTDSDYAAEVSVGSMIPTLYDNGSIADIILTETVAGTLSEGGEVILTLNNSDFEFIMPSSGQIKLTGSKGFAGQSVTAKIEYGKDESQVIITVPECTASMKGVLTISGLTVDCTSSTPKTGDLTLDISGSSVEKIRNVKVGTIASFSGSLTASAVDALSGQIAEITFNLKETVADSFTTGRKIEVSLSDGFFIPVELTSAGKYDASATLKSLESAITVYKYKSLTSTSKSTISLTDLSSVTPILDEDDEYVIGFSFLADSYTNLAFTSDIQLPLSAEGNVDVTVEGRALGSESFTTTVANVTSAVNVAVEKASLSVGVSKQTAGKITITESAAEAISEGYIDINLGSDFKFVEVPTVEVTSGDLEVGKVKYTTNNDGDTILRITVDRDSSKASVIEISDFVVTVSNTAASGEYDIEIGGSALTDLADDVLESEGFFVVKGANEGSSTTSSLSQFVLGSKTYTVNGESKAMDVAVTEANGRIYVPIRFVADALGISGENIIWSSSTRTATILDGSRVLQLGIGTTATLNGVSFDLSSEVVIQDGRVLVPVGEIGRLLGVTVNWDNTTKTATFQR